MKVEQNHLTAEKGFSISSANLGDSANLVLYFGGREALENGGVFHTLKRTYPNSILVGCSTGGEIAEDDVHENTAVSLAIQFEKTDVRTASYHLNSASESFKAGEILGKKLKDIGLKAIFVLSDGLHVNGSSLVEGLISIVGKAIPITGGLAGDGSSFSQTVVGLDAVPSSKQIVAVGFYGDHIRFGHGSQGGWEPFGHERTITRSDGNVLFELDGKPALEIYKSYLGKLAGELPSSALLFPITVNAPDKPDVSVVRTILSIDEDKQSMTFAGDVPEGYKAQLMRGTSKHLVQGASDAARCAKNYINATHDSVAIMISCIGRKLMMGPRITDEVDAVSDVLGKFPCCKAGFFSYGEISPHSHSGVAELHNQTMTITTFTEEN